MSSVQLGLILLGIGGAEITMLLAYTPAMKEKVEWRFRRYMYAAAVVAGVLTYLLKDPLWPMLGAVAMFMAELAALLSHLGFPYKWAALLHKLIGLAVLAGFILAFLKM